MTWPRPEEPYNAQVFVAVNDGGLKGLRVENVRFAEGVPPFLTPAWRAWRVPAAAHASLPGMAIAVVPGSTVKVIDNVLSLREVTIRNDGPDSVTLSKDPAVVPGGGFDVASGATEDVSLEVGQAVYAVVAAAKSASLEVI